ncbi:hypothetical protein SSCG_04639 [Streptomyces clavuligerus]|nr:hydrolase [Streptomyces clavuligerus]EDY51434.1 hypothetical protein SSCG_04639 [Streptomyces clavuligerus]
MVERQVSGHKIAKIKAELLPPNLIGRFRGRARIIVDNLGNTPLTASLTVRDESNGLTFDLQPGAVQIGPGRAAFADLVVRPQEIRWTGTAQEHRLTLSVRRSGDEHGQDLNGVFDQRPVLPPWLVVVGGLLVAACVAFVAIWLAFTPTFGSSAGETRAAGRQPLPQGEKNALPPAPDAPPGEPLKERPSGSDGGSDPGPGPGSGPDRGAPAGGGDPGAGSPDRGGAPAGPDRRPAAGGDKGPSTPDRRPAPRTTKPQPAKPRPTPPRPAPVGPPWRKGYQSDDIVLFAQHRLSTLGSRNPCNLAKNFTPGVIDDRTDRSLRCYQRAVMEHPKLTRQLTRTDPYGTLGRATLASMWTQSIKPSDVTLGSENIEVTKLNAALWWATQAEISDGDLHRDRAYARLGIAYFSGKGRAVTPFNKSVEHMVRVYQQRVGLKATGQVNWDTLFALLGGSVHRPGVPGR